MSEMINSGLMALNCVGGRFWDYAASIFVQSSVLIILLLIIDFLLRKRIRAVFRYCVWMLVFLKLVLPPSLCLPTGISYWFGDYLSTDSSVLKQMPNVVELEAAETLTPEDSALSIGTPQVEPSQTIPETIAPVTSAVSLEPLTWQAVVFLLWLVGVLVISVLLIQRMLFVKGLVAQSEPANDRLLDVLNQCRRQVGIRRNIELRLSNNTPSPAVCGLFKPVILMPISLIEKLSPDKLRAVLIHELAHIKRGDLWVNSMQTFLQVIYFYNPFVWLANAVVRRIREQAVDEMVLVALGAEAKSYSDTLIDIAEMAYWRANFALRLVGVVESKKALHTRIKFMLSRPIPKSAKVGVAGLLIVIIAGAILLPMAGAATKEKEESNARFSATLPSGVAVELVGICDWPKESRRCWRPDGSKLPAEIYATKWNKSPGAGDYGFMFKVNGPEDLNFSWNKIEGTTGWEGSCKVADAQGNELESFEAAISDMKQGQLSTTIRIGIATGPWTTIASHDGKQMDISKQEGVLWSQAFEAHDGTHIVASAQWRKDRAERVVAIGKNGKLHTTGHGSVASGNIDQLTASFRNLKLNQIKEFQYQIRSYDFVTIGNVSLKPGVKTDVQIDFEGQPGASKVLAAMVGTWFFDNPHGDEEQMAIFPDGRVVVLYSNGHKNETQYDNGFIELAEYNGAKCKMIIQEDGTLVQYFNYAETERFAKMWKRIDTQPRTNLLRPLTGPDVQVEVEPILEQAIDSVNYAWQRTDRYGPPNPKEFFPDNLQGGKQLDALFDSVDKDRRPDGEILSTVRQGFRRTSKHRTLILAWIGNKYIWNKQPQNPEAVEIMYHAVPMERHYAIYFGLSVLQPKTPNVLRTLAEVCMQGEDVGRITWGTRSQQDELVSYIEPYLENEDEEKCEMASILLKHFRGEIDFEKWKREKFLEQKKAEFGDKLPEFRDKLLTGNSQERREVLALIQRNGIGSLLDDSFLDAMNACAEDKDPAVRSRVASIAGSRWVWSGEENEKAIQLMLKLSKDEDRDTRYGAVYHGLSTVRNKSETVVRRLVELALADHENNLYGRIVWGLSGPMRADKELSERILAEQLDKAKSDQHHKAALYLLYRDVLKEEPPRDWGLEDVKEHYPEDVFIVYFSAEESFQSKSEDEVWAEFKKNLPDSIDVQRLPNINPRKQNVVFFKIRGEKASDAVKKIIEKSPNLRLGQVAPFPIQMQLFFEEMQRQIELEKR